MDGPVKDLDNFSSGNGATGLFSKKKKPKKPYSKIQKFLWLIAGSEISALEKCPNEYNRHANIGLMILITSLFAAFTSFVAGKTFVEDGNLGVLAFAAMWALVIFSMDRSMVNSIKKEPGKPDKFNWGYFWPRLVLAIILSFFMSIPLDHLVFKEKIKYQMDENANNDWKGRQLDLKAGYNIKGDSSVFNKYENESEKLESQINQGCASCPDDDYRTNKSLADNITSQQLPSLLKLKNLAENNFTGYFNSLRKSQTPVGDPLISNSRVNWDSKLRSLNINRKNVRTQYNIKSMEARTLYAKANAACDVWRNRILGEKQRLDTLRERTRSRLDSNINIVANKSGVYKQMVEEMQGFDTQFVTLFLMPDWGVQILKWLIFLALLVIEILPTYLKLKTPVGQYDWEMYRRDVETEIDVNAKIESSKSSIKEIENYRSKSEVGLNKKVIDNMVDIEERLANEMLSEWESKARSQMKSDMGN
ncbi:hypothetical protein BH10BAC2_BH10BAC2_02310 [soil metagenome]